MAMMWIDHVVRGVGDLDGAARFLEDATGLASVPGGRHPGWGTGNRIVPLGSAYIELLAVVDAEEAAGSPVGRAVAQAVIGGDRWLCWCVATDDLDGVARRLRLPTEAGSRLRPDGATLRWRSAGFLKALSDPALPFFISWEIHPELHPGRVPAALRNSGNRIAWIEIGDDPRLAGWLGPVELPIRTIEGADGVLAVAVATPSGEAVIR
jgi:hypothetical protein